MLGRKQLANIASYSRFGYVGAVIGDLMAYVQLLEELAFPDNERIRP